MNADIEALVLSGELFNGPARSSSPARTPSPDAGWHDEELAHAHGDDDGDDFDPDAARRAAAAAAARETDAIGMGPGRTGVKGVIRDHDEAAGLARARAANAAADAAAAQARMDLGGATFLEEERARAAAGAERVDPLVRAEAARARVDVFGSRKEGAFGHLREVGLHGFLTAVDDAPRAVAVVVHLYDPSLERCYALDEELARLARAHPDTKFLRARASVLGFAAGGAPAAPSASARRALPQADDDDPYADLDDDESDDGGADVEVDTDVLPTLLVYRAGQLVHTWVRVDWEAGDAGIAELLQRHHVLPRAESLLDLGELSLDDEDLVWSDEEEL